MLVLHPSIYLLGEIVGNASHAILKGIKSFYKNYLRWQPVCMEGLCMNTDSLRMLWQAVNSLSPDSVASMTYEELTSSILEQLGKRQLLSADDWLDLRSYLSHKEHLIRDLFCE